MGKAEYLMSAIESHIKMAVSYAKMVEKLTEEQIGHLMGNPEETLRSTCIFSSGTSGIANQLLELDLKKKKEIKPKSGPCECRWCSIQRKKTKEFRESK